MEFQLINSKISDGLITNNNDISEWNHMTKFEKVLNSGVWRFKFEVMSLDNNSLGPVIGLVNYKLKDASFDVIESKLLGINTPKDNNMTKLCSYKVEVGQIIEVR